MLPTLTTQPRTLFGVLSGTRGKRSGARCGTRLERRSQYLTRATRQIPHTHHFLSTPTRTAVTCATRLNSRSACSLYSVSPSPTAACLELACTRSKFCRVYIVRVNVRGSVSSEMDEVTALGCLNVAFSVVCFVTDVLVLMDSSYPTAGLFKCRAGRSWRGLDVPRCL